MNDPEQSKRWFERATAVLVGGVNSPVRAFKAVDLSPPRFIRCGKGSSIEDVDGNRYIDYVSSWGALILGHANPQVIAAVSEAAVQGLSFGAPIPAEVELAERMQAYYSGLERLRFVNSGNEATQGALRVARAYTRREKVIKFAGCYHGSVDSLLVKAGSGATTLGVPDSAGVPQEVANTTLIAEFNTLQSVLDLLEEYAGEVAAVLVEPIPGNMGVVAPQLPFLQGLRASCDREGVVLIFDEVMSGFRVARGGAQELFGIQPDLATFGKVIGGGLPVGAYGGRRELMLLVAPEGPVYQAGTLSGNPIAMAAGLATLKQLEDERVFADLAERSRYLMSGLETRCRQAGIPVQTTCYGGMMGFSFIEQPVRNYSEALRCDVATYSRFFRGLLHRGVYLAPSAYEALFLSTAHSDEDLERTLQIFEASLAECAAARERSASA